MVRVHCSYVSLLCCVLAPPCVEVAGAPGFEPGSTVPQTDMLSTAPCPTGWELAEAPGFEPGSRDPKPLMLSATPCLLAVPSKPAVALRMPVAGLHVPLIVESAAMAGGPLGGMLVVVVRLHHGRPSSGAKVHLLHHLYNTILFLLYYENNMNRS